MPRHENIISDDKLFTDLSDAILRIHEAKYRSFPRVRLGASEVGSDCHRDLWMGIRWASPVRAPKGQKVKIFRRGDREEDRIVADLRAVGWNIFERDDSTGKQWEFTFARGHATCRLDGAANDPRGRFASTNSWFVLEAKTHNNKSFVQLTRHGIQQAHPKHYAQVQIGMQLSGMKEAIYAARNKDNEEDRFIRVEHDPQAAAGYISKAEIIVDSKDAPTRISIDPDWFRCRMCDNRDVCHGIELPQRNCRTCALVEVRDAGVWHCSKHDKSLTLDAQQRGCSSHRWNPSLIKGEPELKHESMEWVQYRMPDGSLMTDNGLTP